MKQLKLYAAREDIKQVFKGKEQEGKHEKLKDTILRPEKCLHALSETHDHMLYCSTL